MRTTSRRRAYSPDTLWGTGYVAERVSSPILNVKRKDKSSAKPRSADKTGNNFPNHSRGSGASDYRVLRGRGVPKGGRVVNYGLGTSRAEAELIAIVSGSPVVAMAAEPVKTDVGLLPQVGQAIVAATGIEGLRVRKTGRSDYIASRRWPTATSRRSARSWRWCSREHHSSPRPPQRGPQRHRPSGSRPGHVDEPVLPHPGAAGEVLGVEL